MILVVECKMKMVLQMENILFWEIFKEIITHNIEEF